MGKCTLVRNIVLSCVLLILVVIALYSGLRVLESTVLRNSNGQAETVGTKTVTVDGVDYFPRQDISVFMVLGIDKYGQMESSNFYRNDGDADMVMLLIFDETEETCSVLCLNRDTMVEMPVIGMQGKQAGTTFAQLALSYTYGTGLDDSCNNVRQTIENLLPGLTVDHYVAMHMDAISILNDAVGGVTVDVTADFSQVDPTIGQGTATLMGNQAVSFVRTRKGVGDQLNLSRIDRQQQYISGFLDSLMEQRASQPDFILSAYEDASPYLVTDCSASTISGILDRYSGYTLKEVVTLAGENVLDGEYYEFYVNQDELQALILRLFYGKK